MAKTIALGYTDTAIAGNPTMTVALGKLNFPVDHRILSDTNGEIITTNVTSPVDQPESFRLAQRQVANVYAATPGIDPTGYLPVKAGTATLLENREVWVETDSVDTTYRKYIPVKCSISVTLPSYPGVTPDMALALVLRTVALTCETGVVTSTGMSALMHGVMTKIGLQ